MSPEDWKSTYGPVHALLFRLSVPAVPLPAKDFLVGAPGLTQRQKDIFLASLLVKKVVALDDETSILSCPDIRRLAVVEDGILRKRGLPPSLVLYDCPSCDGGGCGLCSMQGEFDWDEAPDRLKEEFIRENGYEGENWEPLPGVCLDVFTMWASADEKTDGEPTGRSGPSGLDGTQTMIIAAMASALVTGPVMTNSRRMARVLAGLGCDPVDVYLVLDSPDEATDVYVSTSFNVFVSSPEDLAKEMRRKFSMVALECDVMTDEVVASATESVAHGLKDDGVLCFMCALGSSGRIDQMVRRYVASMGTIYGGAETTESRKIMYARDVSIMVSVMPWLSTPQEKNVSSLSDLPAPGFLQLPVEGGEPILYGLQSGAHMTEFIRALTAASFGSRCYQVPVLAYIAADGKSSTGFATVTRTFRSPGSRYSKDCMRQCMDSTFSFYLLEAGSAPKRLVSISSMKEPLL